MAVLLPLHILGGGAAIVLGGVALLARKGRWLHRRAGLWFVYAMLVMGLSGSVLALRQSLTNPNVLGGFTVTYFVMTALLTVRPFSTSTPWLLAGASLLAVGLVAVDCAVGVEAYGFPHHIMNGVPFVMPFFLGTVTGLSGLGDVRILQNGPPTGAKRLSRHLWRMCFALFIATASFFSIRARVARVLPEPLTTPMMRAVPILFVLFAMVYWLWRVRGRWRSLPTRSGPL
jgi:hypothetical protein